MTSITVPFLFPVVISIGCLLLGAAIGIWLEMRSRRCPNCGKDSICENAFEELTCHACGYCPVAEAQKKENDLRWL